MSSLQTECPLYTIALVHPRYWSDTEDPHADAECVLREVESRFPDLPVVPVVLASEDDVDPFLKTNPDGMAMLIAMSGSVQPWMQKLANHFSATAIFPGYDPEWIARDFADLLLERNASPSSIEMYSVLKNQDKPVVWAMNQEIVLELWRAVQAVKRLRNAKILSIGGTENWVLSANRDRDDIRKKLGMTVERVELDELYELYHAASPKRSQAIADRWLDSSAEMVEPVENDVLKASQLVVAFEDILEKYKADGAAIACFTLLADLDTTSCLAMSVLNDHPGYIGACEGDLDAAGTLMLVKALSGRAAWMANPVVGHGNIINFVHCTAPLDLSPRAGHIRLRTHHESGIGVSPEVDLPGNETVTLVRIGDQSSAMTVHVGRTEKLPSQPTCRTQLGIQIESVDRYLKTTLGNHQIITFGDLSTELGYCARLLNLELRNAR